MGGGGFCRRQWLPLKGKLLPKYPYRILEHLFRSSSTLGIRTIMSSKNYTKSSFMRYSSVNSSRSRELAREGDSCLECREGTIIQANHELVCNVCGLVVKEHYFHAEKNYDAPQDHGLPMFGQATSLDSSVDFRKSRLPSTFNRRLAALNRRSSDDAQITHDIFSLIHRLLTALQVNPNLPIHFKEKSTTLIEMMVTKALKVREALPKGGSLRAPRVFVPPMVYHELLSFNIIRFYWEVIDNSVLTKKEFFKASRALEKRSLIPRKVDYPNSTWKSVIIAMVLNELSNRLEADHRSNIISNLSDLYDLLHPELLEWTLNKRAAILSYVILKLHVDAETTIEQVNEMFAYRSISKTLNEGFKQVGIKPISSFRSTAEVIEKLKECLRRKRSQITGNHGDSMSNKVQHGDALLKAISGEATTITSDHNDISPQHVALLQEIPEFNLSVKGDGKAISHSLNSPSRRRCENKSFHATSPFLATRLMLRTPSALVSGLKDPPVVSC